MVDLTGLSAVQGGWDAEQQRQNQLAIQQQQVAQAQRERNALALLLSGIQQGGQPAPQSFGGGMPQIPNMGAQPQQGAPPPIGAGGPPQAGVGMRSPGTPQGAAAPAFMPQGTPQSPSSPMATFQGAQAPPPQPQPMGGTASAGVVPIPQAPNFEQQLRVMANRIQAANPKADPADIGQAVLDYAKLIQTDDSRENRLLALQMQLQNKFELTTANLQNRLDVAEKNIAGRKDVAQFNADSRMGVAQLMTSVREKLAAGGQLSDQDLDNIAEVRSHGDPAVMSLGWSGPQRTQIMAKAAQKAKERGTTLDSEDRAFHGSMAGATTIGRLDAQLSVGANEIKRLVPVITPLVQKINTSEFPTVNAIENAFRRGTGDPNIVALHNYIQTLRNAYTLIQARGGTITDTVRRTGDSLVNESMPIGQLVAAGQAMTTEAGIVKAAAGEAMQDVGDLANTGGGTRNSPQSAGTAPTQGSGGQVIKYDAAGNRIQ